MKSLQRNQIVLMQQSKHGWTGAGGVAISKSAAQIEVESHFPKLKRRPYTITSSKTPIYNCMAWAVDDVRQWWEYGATLFGVPTFWPNGYPPGETVADVSNVLQGVFRYTPTIDRRARL